MLSPKRTKFRKQYKGRIHGAAKAGTSLNFGAYGLKALEPERITAREIEAARRAITRQMKRAGRVWIRVFPDVPVSKKPAEVRMGSGKGAPEFWVAKIKPGRILFEIDGVDLETAKEAMRLGAGQAFDRHQIHRPQRVRETMAKEAAETGEGKASKAKKVASAKTSSKADDFRAKSADELGDQLTGAEEGAVQPALPARQRPGREYRPHPRRAPEHRPHRNRV